jgi:hypothetical protein
MWPERSYFPILQSQYNTTWAPNKWRDDQPNQSLFIESFDTKSNPSDTSKETFQIDELATASSDSRPHPTQNNSMF